VVASLLVVVASLLVVVASLLVVVASLLVVVVRVVWLARVPVVRVRRSPSPRHLQVVAGRVTKRPVVGWREWLREFFVVGLGLWIGAAGGLLLGVLVLGIF
jgi:hypothetical protein